MKKPLVAIENLEKSFGGRTLFQNLSFGVEEGERIGLVGPNGAGKSTLLKILADEIRANSGTCIRRYGLRVAYLKQVSQFEPSAQILPTMLQNFADPMDWDAHARAREILSRAELDQFAEDHLVHSLSGGWRKRLAICCELMKEPDLLLLDEPTNHLDVEGILWLEETLKVGRFATVTITHDRAFLQGVCNRLLELNPRFEGGLLSISGSYVDFLEGKQAYLDAQASQEAKLKNTLRRETEWLRRGAQARQTKQKARIEAAGELAEKVEDLQQRNQRRNLKVEFQGSDRKSKKLVEVIQASKSFDGQLVVPPIDLVVSSTSRVGILGPNGCGKSTLIQLLVQALAPDNGSVVQAERLDVAYFEQNREGLDLKKTLLQTLCDEGDHVFFQGRYLHVRSYLSRFLFQPEQMELAVGKLSGGEQSRLLLAQLMLKPAQLLVLDEPTNDLDFETLDVLADLLRDFEGAVILVTHDRYFMDQVTDQILAFGVNHKGQKVIEKLSGLEQWESWKQLERERAVQIKNPASKSLEASSQSAAAEVSKTKKKLSYKEQRELDSIESVIEAAEDQVALIEQNLSAAESPEQLSEWSVKLAQAQAEVDRLYQRWEELSLQAGSSI